MRDFPPKKNIIKLFEKLKMSRVTTMKKKTYFLFFFFFPLFE